MKHSFTQVLNLRIVADDTVANLVRIMCFVASVFVMTLSLWKLTRMEGLTEAQLFLGVLLAPITPMLLIIIGLVLPMAIAPKKASAMTHSFSGRTSTAT